MTKNSKSTSKSNFIYFDCFLLLMAIGAISIAIPSFLAASNRGKGKTVEPKQYVSSMNRAQKQHFAEKSAFVTSVNALGIGIKTETENYKYLVHATKQAAFNYGVSKKQELESFVGGVFVIRVKQKNAQDEIRTESIFCIAEKPGTITPLPPRLQNGELICGTGTTAVTK